MNDLNKYLKIIKDSVKEIEKALIVKGKLSYTIQYFPLSHEARQLLAAVFIEREKDNVSLVEYNLFLINDTIGALYLESITREAIDITNYQHQFARFERDENSLNALVTEFKLPVANPTEVSTVFVEDFNRLTNSQYNLKVFEETQDISQNLFPSSDQQQWKMDLKDYMKSRSKTRDMVTFITYLNIRLIAILQDIRDFIETFEGFSIEIKRKRFNESMEFPLEASTMIISSDSIPLIEYNFSWTKDDDQNIHLAVSIICHCQDKIECDDQPSWLSECEYPSTFANDLGVIEEIHDLALKWFVINTFEKMTRNYQI